VTYQEEKFDHITVWPRFLGIFTANGASGGKLKLLLIFSGNNHHFNRTFWATEWWNYLWFNL